MKMENRNQYNSPRDRIDDALLIRLLNEEETLPEYTCTGEARDRSNGTTGCSDNTGNRSGNNSREAGENRRCGCRNNNEHSNRRERRDDSGYGSTRERRDNCGCGNTRERRDDSGYGNTRERRDNCGCGNTRERRDDSGYDGESCSACGCLSGYPLAMVYMSDHDWDDLFDEEEALAHGTLFRPLELPFYPGKCSGNCGCR